MSSFAVPWPDAPESRLFEACVVVSLALHAGFYFAVGRVRPGEVFVPDPIEIDLTKPVAGPGKLAAPKRMAPNAPAGPSVPVEPEPVKPPETKPEEVKPPPVQDWTLPTKETAKLVPMAQPAPTAGGTPDGSGTAAKAGGSGIGSDDGVPGGEGVGGGGDALEAFPKLLNRDEIFGMLRRYYPESERSANREGTVVLAIHVGADGRVSSAEVTQSAGAAFDKAAVTVARLMRFEPARTRKGPVAVKLPQSVVFRLEDD